MLQRLERVLHRSATTSLGIFLATISRSMPQFAVLAALAAIGGVLFTLSLARFRRMLAEIG